MAFTKLQNEGAFDSTLRRAVNDNFSFMQSGGLTNYIASETGANNALVAALLDASGNAVPLTAGLRISIQLGHTLQAGANTLALNGGSAVGIKSHFNTANNIATVYAATGIITLIYNGTIWLDVSQ